MKRIAFTCKREDLSIKGVQFLPPQMIEGNKYPVMIFSHGFTGNYSEMEEFCRRFAQIGYVTFCFSFCGGGKTREDVNVKSDGASTDMSVLSEVEDLYSVITYAKSFSYVDDKKIILVGGSQGGFVSGLTAAKYKDEIAKLVMIFPALCIPEDARRGCLGGADYNPDDVPEFLDCGVTTLGKHFHDEVVGMDSFVELSAYKGPVLILHGMEDALVNYSYSVRAKENYEKGQCHLQLIRNMGHGMDEVQLDSVVDSIRQFLNEKKEILTIRVIITHVESTKEDEWTKTNIYFSGYNETPYFTGTILPGGCDRQEHIAGELTKIRAEYTLEGYDAAGKICKIHIVNQRGKDEWEPKIQTDSESLNWMNEAKFTAVLEGGKGGPTVRIYADKECQGG